MGKCAPKVCQSLHISSKSRTEHRQYFACIPLGPCILQRITIGCCLPRKAFTTRRPPQLANFQFSLNLQTVSPCLRRVSQHWQKSLCQTPISRNNLILILKIQISEATSNHVDIRVISVVWYQSRHIAREARIRETNL